ncbi:MAG: TonB-dependent receptor plug domain-containing protein [Syntrophorhabdaceae bacterium]
MNYRQNARSIIIYGLPFFFAIIFITSFCLAGAGDDPSRVSDDLAELPIEKLMSLDVSTVLGASRYEQQITDAPASITIITSEDIKRFGYRTLADVLNSVPGFYVTYDRNYNYLGNGGFLRQGDYNTRMLMLVDGHRINNNIYDTATIGTEFIVDIDLIDRVEVIRGPGSSLYGSNAFFGVINVLTRKAAHINGFEVSAEAASFDTDKERATFGKKFANGLEMLLSATRYRSKGQNLHFKEYHFPETNFGRSENNNAENYSSLFGNLTFSGLSIEGAYGSCTTNVPTGAWNTIFNDDRTKSSDTQGYIDVRYQKTFQNKDDLLVRMFYDYYRFDGKYIYDYPPVTLNRDLALGKWWGTEALYTAKIAERHTIIGGVEYRDNFLQQQKNHDDSPYVQYLDEKRSSYSIGTFAQGEFVIADKVLLNAGARYDHYKDFSGSFNPRVALIYTPLDQTAIKFIYGQAYRIPNTYELYYSDGVSQKANPSLDPETIRTYEIVLEHFVKGFRISLSGFYYDVDNLISLQTGADGLMVFNNAGRADGKGVQFEIEKKWVYGVSGRLSYSYQEVNSHEDDIDFSNFPKHLAKINIFTPVIKDWLGASLEARYASSRQNLNTTSDGGYTIINTTLLSEKIRGNLDLSFSIYNVLDKKYSNPASREHIQSDLEQDGRVFRFKATYRF